MSEQKDMKPHKMKTEKEETSFTQKSRKKGHSEPTSDELMLRAWQKIYENRHKRLL